MKAQQRAAGRRVAGALGVVCVACAMSACSKPTPLSFAQELELSVRAGRGQLADKERADLRKRNDPLLMQMGDPGTRALIESFASLSDALHRELRQKTYLKWKYSELTPARQKPFSALVETNLAMARQKGTPPNPGFSLEALTRAEVGYAVVTIGAEQEKKVVSIFILWPELPSPTWVTVVNARLAGTQEYFQAHLKKLPGLRQASTSTLP